MNNSFTVKKRRRACHSAPFLVFIAASVAISVLFLRSSDATPHIESNKRTGVTLSKVLFTNPSDEPTTTGQRSLIEAQQLRLEQREESNRHAVQKFKEAAELFRTVNDWQAVANALRLAGEVSQILSESDQAFTF